MLKTEEQARNWKRLDWRWLLKVSGDVSEETIEALDSYFELFAQPALDKQGEPDENTPCLNCGAPLGGIFGVFRWGLVHGEGVCAECGWPARAIHQPKLPSGEIVCSLPFVVLQYHPDFVSSEK